MDKSPFLKVLVAICLHKNIYSPDEAREINQTCGFNFYVLDFNGGEELCKQLSTEELEQAIEIAQHPDYELIIESMGTNSLMN